MSWSPACRVWEDDAAPGVKPSGASPASVIQLTGLELAQRLGLSLAEMCRRLGTPLLQSSQLVNQPLPLPAAGESLADSTYDIQLEDALHQSYIWSEDQIVALSALLDTSSDGLGRDNILTLFAHSPAEPAGNHCDFEYVVWDETTGSTGGPSGSSSTVAHASPQSTPLLSVISMTPSPGTSETQTLIGPPQQSLDLWRSNQGSSPSSTASSWAVITPQSSSDDLAVTSEEEQAMRDHVPGLGPCSKVWVVPKKTRKKRRVKHPSKRRRAMEDRARSGPRRRGPFQNDDLRAKTALTRSLKSCVRCRIHRIRCERDESDPEGSCMSCKSAAAALPRSLCLRWIITDSSLYREQKMPYQMFSRRWQSMDLVDLPDADWVSAEIRTVTLSQIFLDAPYSVEVREFRPAEGDMLHEIWTTKDGVVRRHALPRYALADMKKAAGVLKAFIEKSAGRYINGVAGINGMRGSRDDLFWCTYCFAMRHIQNAKTSIERELMANSFRFWVGCRKTSHPEHICGEDKLGGRAVDDPFSPFHNVVPIPAVMVAQMECILYTTVLQPMQKRLLEQFSQLVANNKREHWLTVYLTMFVLLHSCSLLTRRDWEYARQCKLSSEYANHESISKHHMGINAMLTHFHINKGAVPFRLSQDEAGRKELSRVAELDPAQLQFVRMTAAMMNSPQRFNTVRSVRENRLLHHDLYWVSQLYDESWEPGPTA